MADNTGRNPYEDIINLPHHVSPTRPRMSRADRAAQFSPFAALSGYGDAVKETARLTGQRIELDESAKAALDEKLRLLAEVTEDRPEAAVTYFLPDRKKAGGEYVTATGQVKKLDAVTQELVMANGRVIPIADIIEVESRLFQTLLGT